METLRLQLQFVLLTIHTSYNLFADCNFPDAMNIVVCTYLLSLIVLFSNFYYQSYVSRKSKKSQWTKSGRHSALWNLFRRESMKPFTKIQWTLSLCLSSNTLLRNSAGMHCLPSGKESVSSLSCHVYKRSVFLLKKQNLKSVLCAGSIL